MIIKSTNYDILVKENIFNYLKKELNKVKPNAAYFVITDEYVFSLYKDVLLKNIDIDISHIILIKQGEINKNEKTYFEIINQLLELKIKRDDLIIAFGGGVVGDLAGFVAATLFRGIDYVQIPTTLLAQIDSSVGSKVGINYFNNKNIIGSFYNPIKVFIDPLLLKTLEKDHYNDGIAEMIKISLLFDKDLFIHLKKAKPITLQEIAQAIKLKNNLVLQDPYDKDIRMLLNFGHTFGHQIEIKENISHGKAISYGMLIALKLGINLEKTPKSLYNEVKDVLLQYNLIKEPLIKKANYLELIWQDKKHLQTGLKFIVLKDVEKPEIITINKGDIF